MGVMNAISQRPQGALGGQQWAIYGGQGSTRTTRLEKVSSTGSTVILR
jgi:hypothetical protein